MCGSRSTPTSRAYGWRTCSIRTTGPASIGGSTPKCRVPSSSHNWPMCSAGWTDRSWPADSDINAVRNRQSTSTIQETVMLILAGSFELDPADRDAFIEGRTEAMGETRNEPGNLEYVMSAGPVDPTRVMLFERWADQESLDQHMKVIASA